MGVARTSSMELGVGVARTSSTELGVGVDIPAATAIVPTGYITEK